MTGEPLSEGDQKVVDDVEQYGWHAVHVFDPDGERIPFTYSVGFTKSLGAPECIIFGLGREVMHSMLWEVYRQVQAGAAITHGKRWKNLLEGYECVSMRATHEELFSEYATFAGWYGRSISGEGNPEVYQIVWPGVGSGLLPWDEGCPGEVINAQPRLWAVK